MAETADNKIHKAKEPTFDDPLAFVSSIPRPSQSYEKEIKNLMIATGHLLVYHASLSERALNERYCLGLAKEAHAVWTHYLQLKAGDFGEKDAAMKNASVSWNLDDAHFAMLYKLITQHARRSEDMLGKMALTDFLSAFLWLGSPAIGSQFSPAAAAIQVAFDAGFGQTGSDRSSLRSFTPRATYCGMLSNVQAEAILCKHITMHHVVRLVPAARNSFCWLHRCAARSSPYFKPGTKFAGDFTDEPLVSGWTSDQVRAFQLCGVEEKHEPPASTHAAANANVAVQTDVVKP